MTAINHTPLWISFLQPVATLSAALAVAYYAHQQWKLAHDKLRFDLFERRYKIYEAARIFISLVSKHSDFDDSQLRSFYVDTADAEFFFGPEITAYFAKIRDEANRMKLLGERFRSGNLSDEERMRCEEKRHNHLLWIAAQLQEMPEVFIKYLGYQNIKRGRF